ncbi:hypothetical protein C6P41_000840 [Kluyveromyces marxianus]|uniref:Uncharacterized protein n=1 Tax=Kluyveromyces marxianus TaxID=4911 RepID=A0ABX6EY67_KLUMA|nr:hypothetical protein C6P41_000840 [Kluyveromyces marxianus]QGN16722.1 hypothetical protein FIM1_3443 [Kluyveromyces marxianus]
MADVSTRSSELRQEVEAVSVLISKLNVYSSFDTLTPTDRRFPMHAAEAPEIVSEPSEQSSSLLHRVLDMTRKLLPKRHRRE